ncbi:hypothetical protein NQ318_008968 [Aromia moschata]|uniref:Uncharacterized protein n=1 Tax=Aromia moschata TaxID=1265417 RepID=A0AAV8ZD69_9CUCU|nr:hypothetical protein NQ318_008968 [Aromia moschata]
MDENPSVHKNESLCKVCGDKASGKHYGVASCDGCRGFFKRSIRRNLEYICKENGHCVVDVTRRNQCQACRFKKCLQVNMKRDAVQHERAPRSAQSSLHHYSLTLGTRFRAMQTSPIFPAIPLHLQTPPLLDSSIAQMPHLASHYLHQGLVYPGVLGGFSKPGASLQAGLNVASYNIQRQHSNGFGLNISSRNGTVKDDEVSSSEEIAQNKSAEEASSTEKANSRLELPSDNEPCRTATFRQIEVPCLNLFPAENVYESAAKLLFLAIKWARTIPSFLQLSYRDQSILLEESWSELFVLTAAQWALPVDEAFLISNAVAPSSRHSVLEEDARRLREVITRLNLLRVDHTEHACLKALVLFKAVQSRYDNRNLFISTAKANDAPRRAALAASPPGDLSLIIHASLLACLKECRGLCEPTHVELLQDQTHVMLHEYCGQRQAHHKGRFGKLLLTLPAVQGVSRRGLEELLFRQTVGDVAIDRLLGDLAKATPS